MKESRDKVNIKYSFKKQILALAIILLASFITQIANAAYNSAYLTPEEVRKINQETIIREQAIRVQKKRMKIAQERKKQLKRAQLQRHYAKRGQRYYDPYYQKARSVPAWRRSAGHTMTNNLNDALLNAAKTRNLSLVKELIAEGANVHHKNFDGESALHIAASLGDLQMVRYLLTQRANVNARTRKNWLPIHHAIRFNHPIVANYLIAHQASLWMKNTDGFSALDFAKRSKNVRLNAIARRHGL